MMSERREARFFTLLFAAAVWPQKTSSFACPPRRLSPKVYCGIVYVVHPDICHEMTVAARKAKRAVLEKIASRACGGICAGKTSYMRYDHYNALFNYLAEPANPPANFL